MAVSHVWMPSISKNKNKTKKAEVGRLTVTNSCAVKSFLCKKYWNILRISQSCKIS